MIGLLRRKLAVEGVMVLGIYCDCKQGVLHAVAPECRGDALCDGRNTDTLKAKIEYLC